MIILDHKSTIIYDSKILFGAKKN